MLTTIEKKSLGLATAQLTALRGNFDRPDNWYDAYQAIDAHVTEGKSLPGEIEMLADHENAEKDWGDVHCLIQDEAEAIGMVIDECLDLAKDGIADATVECELDSDVGTYDMSALVDRGAALEDQ